MVCGIEAKCHFFATHQKFAVYCCQVIVKKISTGTGLVSCEGTLQPLPIGDCILDKLWNVLNIATSYDSLSHPGNSLVGYFRWFEFLLFEKILARQLFCLLSIHLFGQGLLIGLQGGQSKSSRHYLYLLNFSEETGGKMFRVESSSREVWIDVTCKPESRLLLEGVSRNTYVYSSF